MIRSLETPLVWAVLCLIPVYFALTCLEIPADKFQPFLMLCFMAYMAMAAACAAITAFQGTATFVLTALFTLALAHLPQPV